MEMSFLLVGLYTVSVMTSVIQVFFHDKLAAVAHVIGADQLPMKSQVMQKTDLGA